MCIKSAKTRRCFKNSVCGLPECDWCPEKGPRPRQCPCPGNKNYKYVTDCSNSNNYCSRQLPITTCTGFKHDLWNSCNENQGDCNNEDKGLNCKDKKKKCLSRPPPFDWRNENLCDFSDQTQKSNDCSVRIDNSCIVDCCGQIENEPEPEMKKYVGWPSRKVYDSCKEKRHYHLRFTTSGLYGRGYNNIYSAVCGKPRCCFDNCCCDCCDLYVSCCNDKY